MKHDILGLLIFFLASIPVGMHAQKSQSSYSVKGVLVDSNKARTFAPANEGVHPTSCVGLLAQLVRATDS